jgi:hypothetical protein
MFGLRRLILQYLRRINLQEEYLMSAVQDLSVIVSDLRVSVDAAIAKLEVGGADNPTVVQAVADLQKIKADLDAQVAK